MFLLQKDIGQGTMTKKFYLSTRAGKAFMALYDFIIKTPLDQEFSEVDIGVHVHRVLCGLIMSITPAAVRAGGLFDIAIALRAYRGSKIKFGPPEIAAGYCAMQQFGMRSVVVHIARLLGDNNDYTIVPKPVEEEPEAIMEESRDEDDEKDKDGDQDEDGDGDLETIDDVADLLLSNLEDSLLLLKDAANTPETASVVSSKDSGGSTGEVGPMALDPFEDLYGDHVNKDQPVDSDMEDGTGNNDDKLIA